MPFRRFRHAFVAVLVVLSMVLAQGTWALAGTTGGISGTLTDKTTGKAVADATITALSPSQTASATTDAGGRFTFLNLAPDAYTISAEKNGFMPVSVSGVSVFADQNITVSLQTQPQLKTIAQVTSRSAGNLVKPGTTSDVYSVNAATQQVVASSGGGFNLNSAYSAIYSQPGVTSYIGNYGWGQVFYIRGSAYSQIGYEFDGVPVNRAFDNYQANSLSNLGQQELQVYTGGSPSGASSATLGGFINQVIKTGTFPGFAIGKIGLGSPFYQHELAVEVGGASPNRLFSYYAGLNGYNQFYPYWNGQQGNNLNSAGFNQYGFTGPAEIATIQGALNCKGSYAVCPDAGAATVNWTNGPFPACQNGGPNGGIAVGYTAANPGPFGGTCFGYGVFGAGYSYFQEERNSVLNLHFGIPHRRDGGRDDIQLLYDNSMQLLYQNSNLGDNGGLAFVSGYLNQFAGAANAPWVGTPAAGLCGYENVLGVACAQGVSPLPYMDSRIFAPGTAFGANAATATTLPYYFPNSPTNRAINDPVAGTFPSGLAPNLNDANWNDVGIVKLQYTKNFSSNAYARLFGYTFYSDWLITGPDCAATGYLDGLLQGSLCGNTADYELATHTRGAELQLVDQIGAQHLLQLTGNYTTAGVSRWNNSNTWLAGWLGSRFQTNLTNGDPNNPMCFSRTSGDPVSCYDSAGRGSAFNPTHGQAYDPCAAGSLGAGTPACVNGAKWLVTTPSGQGTFNTVKPVFTSFALQDEFKPNNRLLLNLGLRFENYRYDLQNSNNPEFNFWFNAQAQISCYDPGTLQPMLTPLQPGQPTPQNPVTTNPLGACGAAPSGQEGLHPVGNTALCNGVTTVDCGPLKYSAASPASFQHGLLSPRIGGTYTMSPNDVFRFSIGKYTQPTETAFEQYLDQSGKRAASFDFSRFWGLGFYTPAHDNPVQYSNNFDFSFEHRFKNTDLSMRLSPFYRDTHNEIVTLVLGPGFVSGTNVGHKHSYGVELGIQKGDPTQDGISGQLSYTYTKALVQYGNLPNGTNAIDYLNNYIKAFNGLTSAGGGTQCYQNNPNFDSSLPVGAGVPAFTPDPTCAVIATDAGFATGATAANVISNPYFNMSQQGLLARDGWYASYPNEPPNDPLDQGGSSAIAPHTFSGWLQWKHNKLAIAPNFELIAGTNYGSPTDTFGLDPRACVNNQAAATTAQGTAVVAPTSPQAQACDFLTAGHSGFVQSGALAIPNPYTGHMDGLAEFQDPWQLNIGALVRYEISPRMTANLSLTNLFNRCFGGTSTAWQKRFAPNNYTCGYGSNAGQFVGTVPGAGFFWGSSPKDPVNGTTPYAPSYDYPFAPLSGAQPFNAYVELQLKL
ncbi:MAG: TonB-dependent receptor [Candidatus Eremiobacteraeota bacterium]|nr:TonB-dependent receptor [Candidatus Eremiobacteraeota bacterium]